MAPTLLAVVVMLLMLKRPGLVIWLGIVSCVASILADTALSFAKAGKLGAMAVGGEFKADVPEGTPCDLGKSSRAQLRLGSIQQWAVPCQQGLGGSTVELR